MDFFATAAKGTEPALRDELRELRFDGVRADRGGVHFSGSLEDGFRACLWSRVAVRILAWRAAFDAPNEDALYEGIDAIDWSPFLTAKHTLAIKATCRSSRLTHTQYIAQRTKDAIVDQMRKRFGARPSVDAGDPDVRITVHLVKDRAEVYLDLSGEPLHLRGYRTAIGEAPLKETLAAAMLRLSGWDRRTPLIDPMCGSGTIAIEAAAWARGIAPGIGRARFGVERWALHDDAVAARFRELREDARRAPRSEGPTVIGSDNDSEVLALARANAARAGLPELPFEKGDVRLLQPLGPKGFVVSNPPYGERLDADSAFYREMATAFRGLPGHGIALLAGNGLIERAMGKPNSWLALFNGPIECRLLMYRMPAARPPKG